MGVIMSQLVLIRITVETEEAAKTVGASFEKAGFFKSQKFPRITGLSPAGHIKGAAHRMVSGDLPRPQYYIEGPEILVQWTHTDGKITTEREGVPPEQITVEQMWLKFAQAIGDVCVEASVEIDGHPIRINGQSEGHFLLSELSKALPRGSYERLADIKPVDTQIYELTQKFVATHEQPHPIFKLCLKDGEEVQGSLAGEISNLNGYAGVVHVGSRKIDMREIVSVSLVNRLQKP